MESVVTAVVTVFTGLGGVGLMFRFLNNKIDSKVGQIDCDTHVRAIEKILDKGDAKFDKLSDSLEIQGKEITEIATTIKWLAKRNGFNGGSANV